MTSTGGQRFLLATAPPSYGDETPEPSAGEPDGGLGGPSARASLDTHRAPPGTQHHHCPLQEALSTTWKMATVSA
jgi:hypothetical protein